MLDDATAVAGGEGEAHAVLGALAGGGGALGPEQRLVLRGEQALAHQGPAEAREVGGGGDEAAAGHLPAHVPGALALHAAPAALGDAVAGGAIGDLDPLVVRLQRAEAERTGDEGVDQVGEGAPARLLHDDGGEVVAEGRVAVGRPRHGHQRLVHHAPEAPGEAEVGRRIVEGARLGVGPAARALEAEDAGGVGQQVLQRDRTLLLGHGGVGEAVDAGELGAVDVDGLLAALTGDEVGRGHRVAVPPAIDGVLEVERARAEQAGGDDGGQGLGDAGPAEHGAGGIDRDLALEIGHAVAGEQLGAALAHDADGQADDLLLLHQRRHRLIHRGVGGGGWRGRAPDGRDPQRYQVDADRRCRHAVSPWSAVVRPTLSA